MPTTEKLIARRVGLGFSREQSEELLAELMENHDGVNLISALAYQHYLSAYMAEKLQLSN